MCVEEPFIMAVISPPYRCRDALHRSRPVPKGDSVHPGPHSQDGWDHMV